MTFLLLQRKRANIGAQFRSALLIGGRFLNIFVVCGTMAHFRAVRLAVQNSFLLVLAFVNERVPNLRAQYYFTTLYSTLQTAMHFTGPCTVAHLQHFTVPCIQHRPVIAFAGYRLTGWLDQ